MPHVEVHTPGVREKSSVAGWFIMSPVVQIQHTTPLNMKEMVANLMGKPGGRMIRLVLIHQESVFGFKSENTVQHLNSPRQIEASSAGEVKDLPTGAIDIWRCRELDDRGPHIRSSVHRQDLVHAQSRHHGL